MSTEPPALEKAAATTPSSARIAQLSLVLGLVGVVFGLFVGASDWVEAIEVFKKAQVVPYILGGLSMLAAIVSLVIEKRYKLGAIAFASGAGAVLIGVILVYVMVALVAAAVISALANQ